MHKMNMQKKPTPANPAVTMTKAAPVPRIVPAQKPAAPAPRSAPVELKQENEEMEVDEDEDDESEGEPVTFCDVCNIDCKTEAGFDTHCAGMAHMMKAQNISAQDRSATVIKQEMKISKETNEQKNEKPKRPPTMAEIEKTAKEGDSIYCKICDGWGTFGEAWENHKATKYHIRRAWVKKKGGLRALVDGMKYTTLLEPPECLGELMKTDPPLCGLEYLVEVRRSNPQKKPYFACMLCLNTCLDFVNLTPHLRGSEHRKKFLKNHLLDHAADFGYLFPKPGTEHYEWFDQTYMRDETVNPPPPSGRPKEPHQKEVRELTNNILLAFHEKFGMQQMQVIQENIGQKPKKWFGKEELRLRPSTPPSQQKVADGNNTPHIKADKVWHAKRIYVGNIPDKCSQDDMKDFFSKQILDLGLLPGDEDIIKKVEMNHEKKFGFIHFLSLDGATACLELDGISYHGYYLKLRRPSQYNESLFEAQAQKFLATIRGASGGAGDSKSAELNRPPSVKPILGAGTKRPNESGQSPLKKGRFDQTPQTAVAQGWSQADYDYYQGDYSGGQQDEYSYFSGIQSQKKNTYSGVGGRYGGQESEPQRYQTAQKPGASQQAPQGRGASQARPAVPAEPPKPKAAPHFMSSVFRKATQILEQNSICSDGERRMAVQVSNLLRNKISSFHNEETEGDIPLLKIPDKTGLMDWLRFLVKALDKGIIKSEGECKLATSLLDLLTARMAVYQSGGATAPPPLPAPVPEQPATSTPAPPPPPADDYEATYSTNTYPAAKASGNAGYSTGIASAKSTGKSDTNSSGYGTGGGGNAVYASNLGYGAGGYNANNSLGYDAGGYSVGPLSSSYSTSVPGGYNVGSAGRGGAGYGTMGGGFPAQTLQGGYPNQMYQQQGHPNQPYRR